MNRRRALKWLGGLGAAGLAGRFGLMPPSPSERPADAHALATRIFEALDEDQRREACVSYDDPYRQYHNRGVWGGGLHVHPLSVGWTARGLIVDLLHAGLSVAGRARIPREYYTRWPGVHSMKILFCGSPLAPPYQLLLTGAHLNLRIGGASREGVAFGGPQVYGDQRGDEVMGLPGNLYRFQLELAQRLFGSLSGAEQKQALLPAAPIQTQIELQGRDGVFPGLPLAGASQASRALARALIDAMISTYPEDDCAYARRCLEENGGVEALSYAAYADGHGQIHRLEGPAAVLYFRGWPHVHAFVNIAMNADAPLSTGELLGVNPAPLEGAAVKALFEEAMLRATGCDEASYELEAVVGRLRPGPIRTGDVYVLESWQDAITVREERGRRVATAGGAGEPVMLLRDAVITLLRTKLA